MSRKKNDAFHEVIVGLFMLAVLALLVYFTVVISGVDVLTGRQKVKVNIVFTEVGGLKDHDSVMYRGTKVGTVDHIDLTPSNLTVVAEVDQGVVLRSGYRIAVCNLSMLGGNYLLMEEGLGDELPLTTTFCGETPTDWMRDVSRIAKNLNDFTSGGELKAIVTNFEATSVQVRELVDRVARGEGTVGRLLSTNDTVYAELQETIANASEVSERLKNGIGTIGKLLSTNDTVYVDLQRTLANAGEISERLKAGEGAIGRLLAKDDPISAELESAIASFRKACESFDGKETVASANRLLENLNAVAEKMKAGEGSLGKLVNSPELYDEVQGLTKDVRQVIDNYRDTTPISTFGSLIMGGL